MLLPFAYTMCLWLSFIFGALTQDDTATEDPTTDTNLLKFRSRPDLYPPQLFVTKNGDGVTPGYIFMAPYQSFQNTAAIYDSDGTLIWYGWGLTGSGNAHDFRTCQYNGTEHLCFYSGTQYSGYGRGQAVIMDTSYQTVRTVTSMNGRSPLDQHEFNIIGDSALTTIYHPMRYDLSRYNVTSGEGWIQDSIFQDVNLTTNELNFEWSAIEHVALLESYVTPNQSEVSGTGLNAASPWDYFHINSVDKNDDGDYLISARHVSTLYKINGRTGEIIWRCGGKLSDFEIPNGLNWSYQHDARWLSQNASTDIISFFDNGSNGFNQSSESSSGYIIRLNHDATPPTVELLHSYPAPADIPISASQGSLQILNRDDWADSNAFANWGSQPYVTEHSSNGDIIYQANVAANGKMNYRAYKFNITLTPHDSPALYTYAESTSSPTTYWMSWNGATELRRWRIYGRAGCDADWTLLDEVDKTDFESSYTASSFQEFGMVEAVGGNGTGLRNSTNRGVVPFVPSQSLADSCDSDGCNIATEFGVSTGQEVVAESQTGCAALPLQTTSESSESGVSENKASSHTTGALSALTVAILCSVLVGIVL